MPSLVGLGWRSGARRRIIAGWPGKARENAGQSGGEGEQPPETREMLAPPRRGRSVDSMHNRGQGWQVRILPLPRWLLREHQVMQARDVLEDQGVPPDRIPVAVRRDPPALHLADAVLRRDPLAAVPPVATPLPLG